MRLIFNLAKELNEATCLDEHWLMAFIIDKLQVISCEKIDGILTCFLVLCRVTWCDSYISIVHHLVKWESICDKKIIIHEDEFITNDMAK